MDQVNVPIHREDGDDEDVATYVRTKLTSNEKLINEFFRAVIMSDKRFTVPSSEANGVDIVIKIADICDEWVKFRETWEAQNGKVVKENNNGKE